MLAQVPYANYKHHTFLGNQPDMLKNFRRLHDWRMDITQGLRVSKMFGFACTPYSLFLVLRDTNDIKHVLKDNFENYTKPSPDYSFFFQLLREWVGDGIFVAQHGPGAKDGGESWRMQRKTAIQMFTRANLMGHMQATFNAKATRFNEVLADAATTGSRVDIQASFFAYTMDSIMQVFFGEEHDSLGGGSGAYGVAFDTAQREMVKFAFAATPLSLFLQMIPWPLGGSTGLIMKALCPLHPAYRAFRAARSTLDAESKRLVALCKQDPKRAERRDLLALFVNAEETKNYSADFLRDVVLNFVLAGRDTTACLLSWLFYLLCIHPEVQEKLREEINSNSNGELTTKSVAASKMPYLNGVIYETLRLYPPVPINSKDATKDDVLPGGTLVPAGAKLTFMMYAMGRDADKYPDPLAVTPERWIPFTAPAPHEFPVFQAGPRICIGMDMAIFEAKVVVCRLLQEYSFTLAPGEAEKIRYISGAVTMSVCNSEDQSSHNLWVIPKRLGS